ncbi:hypothetical protein MhomT_11515 [Microbacterium hominis]|nr:hypothetical protein MhomT_11515 [Microbacterium hominis]
MVLLAVLACAVVVLPGCVPISSRPFERGVNVYTLLMHRGSDAPVSDWGEPQSSYDFLASRGMSIVRLAISWGTLQPALTDTAADRAAALSAPVDPKALTMLHEQVDRIERAGMRVVLDLHNGCTFPTGPGATSENSLICGRDLSLDAQTSIWRTLSREFKDDPAIYAYDIFNEPRSDLISFATYRAATQAVVDAIRDEGDTSRIWVEAMVGNWTFARDAVKGPWVTDAHGEVDKSIVYSQHFYPRGTATTQVRYDYWRGYEAFQTSIVDFGEWCERWGVTCSIGEIGWPGTGSPEVDPNDIAAWNAVGDRAYATADRYGMDVTYFAAMGGADSRLLAYDSTSPTFPVTAGIDQARSQAGVIEQFLSRDKR